MMKRAATQTRWKTAAVANGFAGTRPTVLAISRFLSLGISTVFASPLRTFEQQDDDTLKGDGVTWILYIVSLALVLLGGAFAGLTIAYATLTPSCEPVRFVDICSLMGQDGIYLQVLSRDKTEPLHQDAKRVYDLLRKGKHWVLVTLLLSNVIVNETLPVVLDRCLGGGVAAVVGSTFLIGKCPRRRRLQMRGVCIDLF
jgi:metal transporter CNNM